MSTPSNGSWNDGAGDSGQQYGSGDSGQQYSAGDPGPQYGGQPAPQQGGQPGYGQQSLGQGFGQQQGGYSPAGQPPPGPQQQPAPQQGGAGGNGIADLFSDLGFRKSITESAASIVFVITVIWAVLNFVQTVSHAFGAQVYDGNGEGKLKHMGGFESAMTTLTGLVWMIFVIVAARVLLELCVNVARLARNRD